MEISNFINQFKAYGPNVIDCFLNGMCYYFAQILKMRFNAEIMYDPVINHFAARANGRIYDITGDITNDTKYHWYEWNIYEHLDELETQRIYRDCILKKED